MQEQNRWLDVVEVGEDRVHVIDRRGRYVESFPTEREASAYLRGYARAREDSAATVAAVVDPLAARVGGVR